MPWRPCHPLHSQCSPPHRPPGGERWWTSSGNDDLTLHGKQDQESLALELSCLHAPWLPALPRLPAALGLVLGPLCGPRPLLLSRLPPTSSPTPSLAPHMDSPLFLRTRARPTLGPPGPPSPLLGTSLLLTSAFSHSASGSQLTWPFLRGHPSEQARPSLEMSSD